MARPALGVLVMSHVAAGFPYGTPGFFGNFAMKHEDSWDFLLGAVRIEIGSNIDGGWLI